MTERVVDALAGGAISLVTATGSGTPPARTAPGRRARWDKLAEGGVVQLFGRSLDFRQLFDIGLQLGSPELAHYFDPGLDCLHLLDRDLDHPGCDHAEHACRA